MKHGALEYTESRGEDLAAQEMGDQKSRSFAEMSGATANDNVWFSYIVFESKEHRDGVKKRLQTK